MVKVSVVMITYNHDLYIKEAILGVLLQRTNFEIELIVADDCSTDKTESVIQEIINTHSQNNFIKYTRHTTNKGMMLNFIWALNQCEGTYIALCEGDDYWTDPYKLQKQVDFLEANPDIAISYHRVNYLMQYGIELPETLNTSTVENIYTISDLASRNFIHTPSVVFRRKNITDIVLDLVKISPAGDYVLHMFNALHGDIHYMPEIMAKYRFHENSVWSSQPRLKILKSWINVISLLIPYFDFNVKSELEKQLILSKIDFFKEFIKELGNNFDYRSDNLAVALENDDFTTIEKYLYSEQMQNKKKEKHFVESGIISALSHLKSQIIKKITNLF